jgi:hypothetical protein
VTDTHAHHVQYVAFNHPVTGEAQDLSITKHVQCCAEDGCPICATSVEHISQAMADTSPSDAFTAAMIDKTDDHHQALFEQHSIESANFQYPTVVEESS